jgi:hypothetical protein
MKENFQNVALRRRHVVLGAFQIEVPEPDFPAEEEKFLFLNIYEG